MRLLPWGLALTAFFVNVARGYDFEMSFGILWAILFSCVGFMARLVRLYPFKDPIVATLEQLYDWPKVSAAAGIPVELTGVLEREDPAKPKGPMVFKQGERRIALNRLGALELVPRIFGLANPAQMLEGEVELSGWYRKSDPAFIEIAELSAGKKSRKSMARAMRWTCVILVFIFTALILLTAE